MRPIDNCLQVKDIDTVLPTNYGEVVLVGDNRDSHGISAGDTVLFRKSPDTLYQGFYYVHWTDVYLCNDKPCGHYVIAKPLTVSQKGGLGDCEILEVGEKVTHVAKGDITLARAFGKIDLWDGLQLVDEMDTVCFVQ